MNAINKIPFKFDNIYKNSSKILPSVTITMVAFFNILRRGLQPKTTLQMKTNPNNHLLRRL